MKRRFPAFFLALALCLGLAAPAFAAEVGASARFYPWMAEGYPYVYQSLELEVRGLDGGDPSHPSYGKPTTITGEAYIAPKHEAYQLYMDGFADEEFVVVWAFTDHDGDGVYDRRLFNAENKAAPIPEDGVYKQFSESNKGYVLQNITDIPGFGKAGDGVYAISAASLYEYFGDNTLVIFEVGKDDETTTMGSVLLCAGAFDDVPGVGWYSKEVAWAAEKGIAMGTGEGEFAPGDDCTHIQILTFLSRAAGNTKAGEYDWRTEQEKVIDWATEKGMIDDSFNPQKSCTRAEAVNYIWQAKGKPDAKASSFKDMDGYEDYAEAVNWAYETEVTKGEGGGIFNPGGVCSRAHIATFLYRAYQNET